MSRTYRKHSSVYFYFKSEQEFNEAYNDSLKDYSEFLERKPKLEKGFSWHTTPDAEKVFAVYREKLKEWVESGDFFGYHNSLRYKRCANGCTSYEQYMIRERAIAKSDSAFHWNHGGAPSWYCNLYYERPMRREVKRVLKHAYKYDTFDNAVYPEWTNGAAWTYW